MAKECVRTGRLLGVALVVVAVVAACAAQAQQDGDPQYQPTQNAARGTFGSSQPSGKRKVNLGEIKVPPVQPAAIPVNPTDPIAIVNGQIISRQQLADECVAREGKKVLDTLINRTVIEQALRSRKLEVTAADIDQEIEGVARRFNISREAWLRTLDKERGISPLQYARDIIYPALALRKLCAGRVQVTPKDMQDAFEAQYAEKIRLRMILVDKQSAAVDIWEELQRNPGGFENLAKERSQDPGSRSLGGLLAEPMTRHAYPQNISDAAFRQLVDGDPKDRNPAHKPKDGDFTGPIQISDSHWIILRRESLIPAAKGINLKDQNVRKQTYEMIYDVKLKEAMGQVFQDLLKAAGIENKLTGTIKMAHEEHEPDYQKAKADVDGQVKLMSNPGGSAGDDAAGAPRPAAEAAAVARQKLPTPAALSPDAAKQFENLQRSQGPSASSNTTNSPN